MIGTNGWSSAARSNVADDPDDLPDLLPTPMLTWMRSRLPIGFWSGQ